MILRRLTNAFRRQDWFTVFIETLIVVLGVFLGLQVNNWNTTRSDSRREMAYLYGLHDDFSQIITELQSDSAEYEDIAAAMTLLIDQSRKDAPDVPLETLNTSAAKLVRMVGTPIVSDTYANLTGSGDLAIIKNPRIKIALASFYGQVEVINLVDNTHEMQLVNIFQLDEVSQFAHIAGGLMGAGFGFARARGAAIELPPLPELPEEPAQVGVKPR